MLNSRNTFNVSKENLIRTITLFMFLLAGINVKSMNFYFLLFAVAVFLVVNQRYVFDFNLLILLQLSLAWIIFSPDKDAGITSIIKPMLYPLAYFVGRSFFAAKGESIDQNTKETWLKVSVFVVAFGPYIHYMLNFFTNMDNESRNTIDFWSHSILSATSQATMAFPMMALAISWLFVPTKKVTKIASVTFMITILLYNLILSGRTMFVIMGMVMFVCLWYTSKETKNISKKMKIAFTVVIILLLIFLIISRNVFGLQDLLKQSNLYNRFTSGEMGVYEDTRMERKLIYLQNFETAIWGGQKIRLSGTGYAHDIFLDTYDEAGIFALLAVVEFVVSVIVGGISFIKNKSLELSSRVVVFSVYITMLTNFVTEPILQGMSWMFVLFCFIHGVVVQVDKSSKGNAVDL